MNKRALVSLIPATACLAFAAPALAKTTANTKAEAVSENWAGYEVTPSGSSKFSSVSGGWTQPSVSASAADNYSSFGNSGTDSGEYSAFWVGLGGGDTNSDALEQDGTQADVSASGKVSYYAWYELVPSAPVRVDLKVSPGDKIWAQTTVDGDEVSFQIDNQTTGQDWSKTVDMTAATPDTSTAEWVAEAPSQCDNGAMSDCTPLTLADFGKVNFTDSSVTSTDGTTGSISNSDWTSQPIALEDEASPGGLSSDGTSFAVNYGADSADESDGYGDSTGEGSSTGYGYGGGTTTSTSGYGSDGYGSDGYGYGSGSSSDYGYGSGSSSDYGYGGGTSSDYGSSTGDGGEYILVGNGDGGYTVYYYAG